MCDLGGTQAAATKRVKLGQTLLMAVGAAAAGALRCQLIMVMIARHQRWTMESSIVQTLLCMQISRKIQDN